MTRGALAAAALALAIAILPHRSSSQPYAPPQPDLLQPLIKRLLGEWTEDTKSPFTVKKYRAGKMPTRRTVEFFRDGTAVAQDTDSDRGGTYFTWALSEDGKRIRTTDARWAFVARVTVLTDRELHIEEPSAANGHYLRGTQ